MTATAMARSTPLYVTDPNSSGKNYTLAVAISHPHTETDISFISHIGATGDRYSAAMDTMYLTSRRQRTNIALRGEIDQLRRQIDLQVREVWGWGLGWAEGTRMCVCVLSLIHI